MKVLWCTPTSSSYNKDVPHHYYGCGWIESLEELISNDESIDLAITFLHKTDIVKVKKDKTTYYPIKFESRRKNIHKYLWDVLNKRDISDRYINRLLEVIKEFKPDVIHVFGTETFFATIQEFKNIPVVIHLQGLINPILNAFYPVNSSKWNFILSNKYFFDNLKFKGPITHFSKLKKQAVKEAKVLRNSKYVMGRTNWDQTISQFYNSNVTYFHINEVMRPVFYKDCIRPKNSSKVITIVSTISPTIYKGLDLILKTAELLKKETNIEFVWKLVGLTSKDKLLKHFEKELNLNHDFLNIQCLGLKTPDELVNTLNDSDLFIHPSYIDNSPNSVCEAQILGLPVIACNVGGITSLIKSNETGILIPANGMFELAIKIKSFYNNKESFLKIGEQARSVAIFRHNKKLIKQDMLNAYLQMIKIYFF
jgi:glycosyltransferase involved in cell wall biosynthesis